MTFLFDETVEPRVYLGIECNGCGAKAPPASEILAGHGLVNMGWRCTGGAHFCPACNTPAAPREEPKA